MSLSKLKKNTENSEGSFSNECYHSIKPISFGQLFRLEGLQVANKTLSLDQASWVSGYAVWEGSALKEWGEFNSKGEFPLFLAALGSLLEKHSFNSLIIEDVFMGPNRQTFKKLSQLQGVIIGFCIENDIECKVVAATTWRKAVGVSGANKKKAAKNKVKELYGLDLKEDIAEAVLIGRSEVGC